MYGVVSKIPNTAVRHDRIAESSACKISAVGDGIAQRRAGQVNEPKHSLCEIGVGNGSGEEIGIGEIASSEVRSAQVDKFAKGVGADDIGHVCAHEIGFEQK